MEYLKKNQALTAKINQEIRETLSKVLLEIERDGMSAVHKYSQEFDGYYPARFYLDDATVRAGLEVVEDQLAEVIDLAIAQVRHFARLQRQSLTDFEAETLPGVTLGQNTFQSTRWVGMFLVGVTH
jgi:sulfopropanediol 3-dehydrogenase